MPKKKTVNKNNPEALKEAGNKAFMVGNHDIGISFVGRELTTCFELPQGVQPLVQNAQAAKGVSRGVTAFIERGGGDPHKKNNGSPNNDDHAEGKPAPQTQNTSFHHRSCLHIRRCHKVVA